MNRTSRLSQTRGAQNYKQLEGLIPEDSTAYFCTQNDAAGRKWEENATGVLQEEGIIVKIVATPKLYKDIDEWIHAEADSRIIQQAIARPKMFRCCL